jgi:hypothetical protein
MKKPLIATAALIAALNLSGCMLVMSGSDYHGDHGDLVSSDGSVRYVGWCDVHRHNSRCLNPQATAAAAPATTVDPATYRLGVALNPDQASPDIADIN